MKRMCLKAFSAALILALLLGLFPLQASPVQAVSTSVVISQVYGGGGNTGAPYRNDFVELFNLSASPVVLDGMSIQYASATGTGNFGSNSITALTGTLAPGQYYLVQMAGGANGVALPTPDVTGTVAMALGSGKVALVNSTAGLACNGGSTPCTAEQLALIIDLVGYGTANFYETSPAPTASNTTAVIRNSGGCVDSDNNAADFTAGAPAPRNTASALNVCSADTAPVVTGTVPANTAVDVALNADITVTFSEPVNLAADWFSLSCSFSGAHTADVTGGPEVFVINPVEDFANSDSCTLTVFASAVTDQDDVDPPDAMAADVSATFTTVGDPCLMSYTPAYAIQGSGATPAITGPVTTMGVVVGDYEGPSPAQRGFFLQDLTGDGDAATSDGIFVFNGNNNSVSLGDVVRVTGSAADYQGQTQISSVSSIVACGTGSVEPVDVTLPFASATAAEQYEGMLVRLPQTLYVTEHYQLGRFGQVVLSVDARQKQPTNVVLPGADAQALQEQNNLSRIIVDDALNNQNPDPILFGRGGLPLSADNTLRGGDTATGIVGVMTYTWGGNSASPNAYRVRPVNALGGFINFEPANPRPEAAPAPAGLRVAGMNLLNFFNTFTGCTNGVGGEATDCRGAYNQAEYDRQLPKTVAAIIGTQADVIGVIEIENDGYGPGSAIAVLVDALNAATAPGTYAFIDVDRDTGQLNALGTDAIKVGLLYKPAVVMPVGNTAALNSVEFVNGGDGAARNRPALAQAFEELATGGRLVVAVNHLKSKGSACDLPDAGDGQGNCNAVRVNAANLLTTWLAGDPTGTGDTDALILGDLNSYAMEDPITAIKAAGYTDLINLFGGEDAYSYVFDGQWGYLDHALSNASLTPQVVAVADWHINSDEPSVLDYNMEYKSAGQLVSLYAPDWFRIADHDPVLVDLNLTPDRPISFATGSGWIRFSAGAYLPDPQLESKAKFAFDVKYLKGAVKPTGKSAFMVQGGVPNFVTTTFDWLAISGNTALFQSKGTLNGYGSYIMRVTAQDDAPDALRVRIWDAVTGALVFDNLAPEPLGGGSIQLHK